jgi:hypothetical protein
MRRGVDKVPGTAPFIITGVLDGNNVLLGHRRHSDELSTILTLGFVFQHQRCPRNGAVS